MKLSARPMPLLKEVNRVDDMKSIMQGTHTPLLRAKQQPNLWTWRRQRQRLCCMLFGLTCSLSAAWGQTNTWLPASGFWNTGSNWSLGVVPTAAHTVVIPSPATIFYNTNGQCDKLILQSGTGDILLVFSSAYTMTVGDSVIIHAGASISSGGDDRTISVNSGILTCSSITMDATSNDVIESKISLTTGSVTCSGNITMNSPGPRNVINFSDVAVLNIGAGISGGALDVATGEVNYNGSSAQTIYSYGYGDLTTSGAGTKTLGENCTITGNLLVESGSVLSLGSDTLTIDANADLSATINGTLNIDGDGRLQELQGGAKTLEMGSGGYLSISDAGGSTLPVFDAYTLATTSTVDYASSDAQTIANAAVYGNVKTSGNQPKTIEGSNDSLFVAGDLIIDGATTLVANNNTIILGGDWINNATFSEGTSLVSLNGTTAQTIDGSAPTTFDSLEINNGSADVQLTADITVSSNLIFTSGIVNTGANTLIVSNASSSAISGASNSAYVQGNLQRTIAADANTYSFPIGSATAYAPVVIDFTAGTTAGTLVAATYEGDHPNIGSSTLDDASSVNRYWIFVVQSGLSTANYNATFNWDPTDEDASFDYDASLVGKYTSSTWSYPTIGTRLTTSVEVTGLSGFSDFQVSSCAAPVILNQPDSLTICQSTTAQFSVTDNNPGSVVYQWYKVGTGMLSDGGNISGATNDTLTITNASSGDSGEYYVVISRDCGNDAVSDTVPLTVFDILDYGTLASGNETLCSGGDPANIQFSVSPSGGAGPFSYQWYYSDGIVTCPSGSNTTGWTAIAGATNTSYDPPSGLTVSRTYAILVDPGGVPDCGIAQWADNCRQISVNDISAGSVTGNQTICSGGDPATFAVDIIASGSGTLTYQWQSSTTDCNTGFVDISGATDAVYDVPSGLTTTTYYRRQVISTLNGVPCDAFSNCLTIVINAVDGGSLSTDQTLCSGGDPMAFTEDVAATGSGTLTYQWQGSTTDCNTGFIDISGATDATYDEPSGLTTTTYYRRVATSSLNSVSCDAFSNCLSVYINNVTAGSILSDQTICSGGDPDAFTIDIAATGSGTLTYQWQSSTTDCGTGFIDIGGATDATYDVPAGLTDSTYYRRVVTSTLNGIQCTAIGNCITVLVNNVLGGSVLGDQAICSSDDPAVFTIDIAASGSGALTYQWQSSTTDCNTGFVDIPGATEATYDAPVGLTVTTYYRRAVTSALNGIQCTALSNCVTVEVNDVTGGTLLADQTVCSGGDPDPFTIDVSASGTGTLTYQWQSSTADCSTGFVDIPGATDATYDVPVGLTVTTYFRRVVTSTLSGNLCTALSNCLTIDVNDVNGGSVLGDQTVCSGGNPDPFTIDVSASGTGTLSYQWQSSTINCNSGFTDISGASDAVYDVPSGISVTTYYRRNTTSTLNAVSCSALSNCVTILVNTVDGGTIQSDRTVCSGGDPNAFTNGTSASGSGTLTYQWQSSTTDCNSGFTDIPGETNETYDAPAGFMTTTFFRRTATYVFNGISCMAPSNCVTVFVNDVTSGTIQSDQTICSGGDPGTLAESVAASGTGILTYQWQSSIVDCNTGFSDIPGATNSSYDPPSGLTVTTYFQRQVTSTLNGYQCTATGNCVTVTINDVDGGAIDTDQTVCPGGDPNPFTETTPAAGSGTLTYQWQSSTTDCNSGFGDISGATNTTYDPPSGLVSTTFYRRAAISTLNGVACTAYSNCLVVTVNTVEGGTILADQTICSGGDPAGFTNSINASGSGALTYQWQSSDLDCSSGFTDISGATNSTYDPPSGLVADRYYRLIVTSTLNGLTCDAMSNCVHVFVNDVDGGSIATDQTVCAGGDPALLTTSISATGSGTLTYQWQSSTTDCNTGFTDISGATNSTYDPPSGLNTTTYIRRVTLSTLNGVACSALSNCVTLTPNAVDGGTVFSDQTVCSGGDPAPFTIGVAATGSGTLTYQWQNSTTDCNTGFTDISGATNDVYDPPSGLSTTTYYRRITTSGLNGLNCSAVSNCIILTVNQVDPGVVSGDQTYCAGGSPTGFSVDVSATGSGTLTYQWQNSTTDCNTGFTDISGATGNTYTPPSSLPVTTYYRKAVTSTLNGLACTEYTNCVVIYINTVDEGTLLSDQTVCYNGDPDPFVEGIPSTGAGVLSYQWRMGTHNCNGNLSDIPGATDASYDPPPGIVQESYFRRTVTSTLNGVQCSAQNACLTLFINSVSEGGISGDQTICPGGDPSNLTQTGAGSGTGTLTYQWQSSITDCISGFSDIPGATNNTYDPPSGLMETTYFRRAAISTLNGAMCVAYTNCVTVTVNVVDPGIIASDQNICLGADPAIISDSLAAMAAGSLTYQWQSSTTDCNTGFTDIVGATDASYDPPADPPSTTYYRRVVTSTLNGVVCSATGNCVAVTLNMVTGGAIIGDQNVCPGEDPAPFTEDTASTGSGVLSYQWQSSTIDCNTGFTDIPGATNTTYDQAPGLADTTYFRRITISTLNGQQCTAPSNCVTLDVSNIDGGVVESDQTICSGGDPAAIVETIPASGTGTLTYQWQSSTTNCTIGFADIPGATDLSYDPPGGLTVTTHYRRRVDSDVGEGLCYGISNCVTVEVNDISAGNVNGDSTICSGGDPAAFTENTLASGSGVLTYQWQSSTIDCNSGFGDIIGATDATYDIPAGLTTTTYYLRVVTSTLNGVACTAQSNCITVTVNDVSAGSIAGDSTICSGGDPAVFVENSAASGSGALTYQWQSSITDCNTGFSDIVGATNLTYDVPSGLTETTHYRRVATSTLNGIGCSAMSNCVSVSVNDVSAGSVTGDQTICSGGDPAMFAVDTAATGTGTLTYQWQSSTTDCTSGFSDIGGATNSTYDIPSGLIETTYYRRIVTSTLSGIECNALTNCISVTVNDVSAGSVTEDQTICSAGDPAMFAVGTAATGTGTLTYQWQSSTTDCTSGFSDISGATSSTYDVPPGLTQTTHYRRMVTSTLNSVECSALSNCISVSVNDVSAGSVSGDQTICSGDDPAAFSESGAASGTGTLTYQWQSSTTDCNTGFADISGATNTTYDIPSGLTETTYYRRVVTSTLNGVGCSISSNCLVVTVNDISAGSIDGAQTICSAGDPAAFTQSGGVVGLGSLSFQWQSSTTDCNTGFSDIAGATNSTYDAPSGLTATTYYRRVVTSTFEGVACSAQSNCLAVTVNDISAGSITGDQTICSGGDPAVFTESATASGSGMLSYQWQSSTTDCSTGFSDIAGATNTTYDVPSGLTVTTYYQRVATSMLNGVECSAQSNCVSVTVNDVSAGSVTGDQTICSGGNPSVFTESGMASGSGTLSYQWQSSTTDCNTGFSDIVGATNSTYNVPPGLTTTTYYQRVATSTLNGMECSAQSNCISVTVNDVSAGSITGAQTICSGGDPAVLTESGMASGSGTLSYQWQSSTTDCNTGFGDIGGATNTTYNVPPGLTGTTYYRRVVTSTLNGVECNAQSNCISVTVNEVSAGSITGDSTSCSGGDPGVFQESGAASGTGTLTYQWQSSTTDCNTGFSDISGATSSTYDVPSGLTQTTYYRRMVTSTLNGVECSTASNCITVVINNVDAGEISGDQTVCSGGNPAAFTENISASGSGTLSYQWQSSTADCNSGFSDIIGATNAVYDVSTGLIQTTYYRRVVTSSLNGGQCVAQSNCLVVTVNEVSSGTIYGDQTVCSGGDPTALTESGSASGSGTLTYQWQSSIVNCNTGFSDIPGATNTIYDGPAGLAQTTFFRREATSTLNGIACSELSNCIAVVVNSVDAGEINGAQTVCSGGDPAAFTENAPASGSGPISYQWQSSVVDCNTGFSDVVGATNSTYDVPSGLTETTHYRRVVTSVLNDVTCSVASNCLSVMVNNVSSGSISGDQTVCADGDPAAFTESVSASGSGMLSYQWQSSTVDCNSGFSDIPGATDAAYDVSSGLTETTYYRRVVTSTLNGVECVAQSNCLIVTVNAVNAGSISGDQTVCSGGDPGAFTESGTASGSGTLTYQWQSSTTDCNSGFGDIAGATNTTYDVPSGITQTTYYRRTATSMLNGVECSDQTNCLTVAVNAVNAGMISGDQTICFGGDPAAFTESMAASGSGSLSYRWQASTTDCNSGFSDISGATNSIYNVPSGLTQTSYYRRVVTSTLSGVGCSAISNCVTVTVFEAVDYGSLADGDESICPGGNPSDIMFSTYPSGGAGMFNYQWYYQDGLIICPTGTGTSGWTAIVSATNDSYNPPAGLTGSRTYAVQVDVLGNPDCAAATWADNCRQVLVYDATIVSGTISGADTITICDGGNPDAFSAGTPSGGDGNYVYQWQQSENCTGTWSDATAEDGITNTLTFDPPVLSLPLDMICYRLKITDGCGTVGYSMSITHLVVIDPISPPINPTPVSGTIVCLGDSVSATFDPGNGGTGVITDTYEYSTDGGINWDPYTAGSPIIATTAMIGMNMIQVRTQRTATGYGCNDASYEMVEWSVDTIAPEISSCPIARYLTGCDLTALTGPVFSNTLTASSYSEFSNATNLGVGSDNCAVTQVAYLDTAIGTCPIVVHRTWVLSDSAGNSTACSQTIEIAAPVVVVNCPNNVTVAACSSQGDVNTAFNTWIIEIQNTITGGCAPQVTYKVNGVPVNPADLTPPNHCSGGATTVVVSYTDNCETGTDICSSTFTVNMAPSVIVSCPGNQSLGSCTSQNEIDNTFATWITDMQNSISGGCSPVVTYKIGGVSVDPDTLQAPEQCAGGSMTIKVSYTDLCESGTDVCTSTFSVTAVPPLNMSCPSDVMLDACMTQQEVDTAFDAWISDILNSVSGGCSPVVIYYSSGIPVNPDTLQAPDNCGGGNISISINVQDSCDIDSCSMVFNVTPTPDITVDCPADISLSSCVSQQEIADTFAVWISDLESAIGAGCNPQITYTVNGNQASDLTGVQEPTECIGDTIVIVCSYVDVCGNGNCSSTFMLPHNAAPVFINPPDDQQYNTLSTSCQRTIPIAKPGTDDDCGDNPVLGITSDDPEITFFDLGAFWQADFPLGVTTITITATDGCGNTATHVFTITIVDQFNPVITGCPSDRILDNSPGQCGAEVYWTPPTASDNCPGVILSSSNTPGDFFDVGTSVVTYTATDVSGLTSVCTFNVTIEDTEAPAINCNTLDTIFLVPGYPPDCVNDSNVTVPQATDNCEGVIAGTGVRSDGMPLNDPWEVGTTTITWTFTDNTGNASTCEQAVVVQACVWPSAYVYVDSSKTSGAQTGYDWDNAFLRLEDAIYVANIYPEIEEIWVAGGTYFPTTGFNRSATYLLPDSIKIYGGFAGIVEDLSDRDVMAHPTYLKGDIGAIGNNTDNTIHIITVPDTVSASVLDGFVILDGNANANWSDGDVGAGALVKGGVKFSQCVFEYNNANSIGAAIYGTGSSAYVIIKDCAIMNNTSVEKRYVAGANNATIVLQGTNTIEQ